MGKSGGRRKKGGGSNKASVENSANGSVELDSSASLKKIAHELKEEGNRRFQNKDYAGALEQYDNALRLTPKNHPDRAVFHSNRAACLMQMKPIDHESVIAECTMALQVQPQFVRALLRRARAYESVGNYEMAVRDVKALLASEPTHSDALEIVHRLRTVLEPRPSPAALAVRGPPISGPDPKKPHPETKPQLPKPSNESRKENQKEEVEIRWRPLKLVYDHDIRLAQMPMNCRFRALRDTVRKKFPSSNSILIKYKDNDGDLVTITSTDELRMAESSVDTESDSIGMLRLNIVEVSPEQEPPILEEEEQKPVESSSNDSKVEKDATKEDTESKEVEMDDWMFEFAQLFRSRIGIDGDGHVDLHELGVEFCSEALEELVTGEEAQGLFDKAALKFQEVAALAFFNWGNVHMCAARKRVPLAGKEKEKEKEKEIMVGEGLQVAYDWVKEKYCLAREKYEQALLIKPDFHEGLLALGQQQFELAKLHWSFVLAKKIDLSGWDSRETLQLFDSAEEKMKAATEMWEKLEEHRSNELKKEEFLRRKKKQGGATEAESSGVGDDVFAEEAAQQATVMRSQIHLFWGNMLFERSQVECKLGMADWKKNLDAAIVHFKLAGATEVDISMVLKNHCSNGVTREGEVKGSRTHNPITLVK